MTAPRRPTRAEQQARTRQRLLDAAADAFAEHGFEGASIDDIAARAGFSRGAFYSNFDDKSDLLVELIERHIADRAEVLRPAVLDLPAASRPAAFARWLAREQTPLETLLLIELARRRTSDPQAAATVERAVGSIVGTVDELLRTETAPFSTRTDADRAVRVQAMLVLTAGANVLRHLGVELDEAALRLLLGGIVPEPVGPGPTDEEEPA